MIRLAYVAALTMLAIVTPVTAQTRSMRDSATAYGARLDAKGRPTDLGRDRVNSRISSRIENRLSLRIERYRPDSANYPIAAYKAPQDDKSRNAPVITPPPLDESTR